MGNRLRRAEPGHPDPGAGSGRQFRLGRRGGVGLRPLGQVSGAALMIEGQVAGVDRSTHEWRFGHHD